MSAFPGQVFFDVNELRYGANIRREVEARVADCTVVLPVIGKGWLDARDPEGRRRLDLEQDDVRLEIETAIRLGKALVPVLVDGATMPRRHDLPECLRALSEHKASILAHHSYDPDVCSLIETVKAIHRQRGSMAAGSQSAGSAAASNVLSLYYLTPAVPDFRSFLLALELPGGPGAWRIDPLSHGVACTSPLFNSAIVSNRPVISLEVRTRPWLADERISTTLREFVTARNAAKPFDNDPKIRLATDIEESSRIAVIERTDYLSSMMTDQIAGRMARSVQLAPDLTRPKDVLWSGIDEFCERTRLGGSARLKPLAQSLVSNQLGASTLAFSSDGHLMIVGQNAWNRQSGGLLAPSGSGSFDWSDLTGSGAIDLLELVAHGANRELREECSLHGDGKEEPHLDSKVLPLAFTRMLHRAGKPEFICLGYIAGLASDLCSRRREFYVEGIHQSGAEKVDWERERPSAGILRCCSDYLARTSINGDRIALSAPLEHGLLLLCEACASERSAGAIDRFFASCRAGPDASVG